MRVKQYDVDGFGEPFVNVILNQDDINVLFYALSDRCNILIKQNKEDKADQIQKIIDTVLDIDDELFKMRNERE